MTTSRSILYIQHAGAIGGSVISLRELVIDALRNGYSCSVVCPDPSVAKIYQELGANTFVCTVAALNHNTAGFYKVNLLDCLRFIKILIRTCLSFVEMLSVVRAVRPDVIHLNSSTLILYTVYFRIFNIPTVFHVREFVVRGYFGFRRFLIRKIADFASTYVIYISEYEYEQLKTKPEKSFIIYNYVHEDTFTAQASQCETKSGGIKLITLGGLFSLKGGKTILESLTLADDDVELLILGSEDPRENGEAIRKLEGNDYFDDLIRLLEDERIGSRVKFIGKVINPAKYISMSDVVIFWANSPHFPRPVFEAWLLKRPVIYFNPLFNNPLINSENVCMVQGDSASDLRDAIRSVKKNFLFSEEKLNESYKLARGNFTEQNFQKINTVYQLCLNE